MWPSLLTGVAHPPLQSWVFNVRGRARDLVLSTLAQEGIEFWGQPS